MQSSQQRQVQYIVHISYKKPIVLFRKRCSFKEGTPFISAYSNQNKLIEEHIAKNTELRGKFDPKDKFGKDFYKILNMPF